MINDLYSIEKGIYKSHIIILGFRGDFQTWATLWGQCATNFVNGLINHEILFQIFNVHTY
jgi:hypothetical protein